MGKIKEFFKFLPYDIWYGVKNIILFLPTIWRFRTWNVDTGVILLIKRALEVTKKEIPPLINYYEETDYPLIAENLERTKKDIEEILELINTRFFFTLPPIKTKKGKNVLNILTEKNSDDGFYSKNKDNLIAPTDEDYRKLFELLAEKLPRMWFP